MGKRMDAMPAHTLARKKKEEKPKAVTEIPADKPDQLLKYRTVRFKLYKSLSFTSYCTTVKYGDC